MKRQSILIISATAVLALVLLPGHAVSQQKVLKEQLVGTWTLVSVDMVLPDGTKRHFRAQSKRHRYLHKRRLLFSDPNAR